MFKKVWQWSLVAFIALLPWAARYIYFPVYFNGGFWEYGSMSWYATEIILWVTIILFAVDQFFFHHNWPHLFGKIHFKAHAPHLVATLAFVGFLIIAAVASTNFTLSYNFIFHVLEGLCLALIIYSAESKKHHIALALWWSGVAQAVLGVYQFFVQEVFACKWLGMAYQSSSQLGSFVIETGTERWLRAYGSFGSPNILGGFLAVVFIIGLVLYRESRPWHKIFYTLGQSAIVLGLLFSFSRGAWLAATVGWFILGVQFVFEAFHFRQRSFWARFHPVGMFIKQTVFYILITVFTVTLFSTIFSVRFDTRYRLENRSIAERVSQYAEAKKVFIAHPIVGVGPGVYTLYLFQNNPTKNVWEYQPVHNVWVLIAAEWGIVGLVVWLSIFVGMLKKAFAEQSIYLGLLGTLCVLTVVDHFWWSLYVGQMLWWTVVSFAMTSHPKRSM